ncbi:MAG: histidine phosphatase family protein [Faecalibacterium sp.]
MKTFKLHLIRHGMTAGNLQGLYIGSGTDIPLCDEGRAQLKELKERFEYPQVDTVFSSRWCALWRQRTFCSQCRPPVHSARSAGSGLWRV